MFSGAEAFEGKGNINSWKLNAGLTTMTNMFNGAKMFNADISGWDVKKITSMFSTFRNAEVFNRDISGWNVGAVTTMALMFQNAAAFTQNLEKWGGAPSNLQGNTTVTKIQMFVGSPLAGKEPSWY